MPGQSEFTGRMRPSGVHEDPHTLTASEEHTLPYRVGSTDPDDDPHPDWFRGLDPNEAKQ